MVVSGVKTLILPGWSCGVGYHLSRRPFCQPNTCFIEVLYIWDIAPYLCETAANTSVHYCN